MGNLLKNKWLLLGLMALTWGSSFILIKKALIVFDPYQIGAFRVTLSGLLLAGIGIPALINLRRKDVFWIGITGFFGNFAPLFLIPMAQTHISSSLAGIINALEPIFVLILGFIFFRVHYQSRQIVGAFIGFMGALVLVFFSDGKQESSYLYYTFLMILGSVFYALSALIIKWRLAHIPSLKITGGVYTIWMIPAIILLLRSGFFTTIEFDQAATWKALSILSFLTIVSTTIAMALFYKLIQETSAVFASTVSFLIPIVAVVWGILDGEEFIIWYGLGALLILVGIYLTRERA